MRFDKNNSPQLSGLRSLARPLDINPTGLTEDQTGTAIVNAINSVIDSTLDTISIPISGFFEFNVKTYGASGDGITDDTDALQNTFNAMINSGERNILRIPPGIYKFTRPLKWYSHNTPFNINAEGAVLLFSSSDPVTAITIGATGAVIDRCFFNGLDVYNETRNWTIAATGVEFVNLFACQVTDFSVTSFKSGFVLTGYNRGNSYNRFTLNRIRGNQYGLSLKRYGSGGYVTQQLFVGGSWNSGTVNSSTYDHFIHVNFPTSTSLYGTFHFDYCAFEGGFDVATSAVTGYAFNVNVMNVIFHQCRFEFMSGVIHWPAYGIFGTGSAFCTVHHIHSPSDIIFLNSGTYNQIWYADRMNTVGSTTTAFRPIINGRIGINTYNAANYGLHVMYDAYKTESEIGSSGIMQVGENSPTLGATALSVYTGTGVGIYVNTFTGIPITPYVTNTSTASHNIVLSLTHALSGGLNPLAGYFGSAIAFRSALQDTASLGLMALIYCTSDDVTPGNKRGRFRFITYGGSGTFTSLQLGNTGLGGAPTVGFFGNNPTTKPTVSGYTLGTGVESLLSGLNSLGLITNATEPMSYLYLLWSASTSGDSLYKLRVGGNNATNSQTAGFFESGSGYAVSAQTRTGIPLYASVLHSTATSDPTQLMMTTLWSGTGSVSAGFGSNFICRAAYSTGELIARQFGQRNTWVDASSTYKSRWRQFAYDSNEPITGREIIRGESNGTAGMVGFLGAAASPTISVSGNIGDGSYLIALGNAIKTFGLITSTISSSGECHKFIIASTAGTSGFVTLTKDHPDVVFADGYAEITLPSASTLSGKTFTVKRRGTSLVKIIASGGATIDGASTKDLTAQYQFVKVMSDGTNWNIIG